MSATPLSQLPDSTNVQSGDLLLISRQSGSGWASYRATLSYVLAWLGVGKAGGVAGLDASGRVTAPSIGDVTDATVTPTGGAKTTVGAGLAACAAAVSGEATRATGVESTLQANINAEATIRANADSTISAKIGGYSAFIYATGNLTLTAANAGALVQLYGPAGTSTTLASGGTVPAGQIVTFYASSTAPSYVISAHGSELIWDGAATYSAVTVLAGSMLTLMSRGYGQWDLIDYVNGRNVFTVSQLPTAGLLRGTRAYVADANAPAFLGALTGGGSTGCPVVFNGSSWVAG